MSPAVHQLCPVCRKLQFKLKDRHITWKEGWLYENDPPQSGGQPHHKSLEALERSAKAGCHLCSIFSFGLKHGLEYKESSSGGIVKLYYTSSEDYDPTLERTKFDPLRKGFIVLSWGDCTVEFDVVVWPNSSCSIQRRIEPIFCSTASANAYWACSIDKKPRLVAVLKQTEDEMLAHKFSNMIEAPQWLPRKGYSRSWVEPHLLCNCGKGVWEPPLLEKGQISYIADSPLSQELHLGVSQWMRICEEKCGSHLQSMKPMPLRLVDVGSSDGTRMPFLSVESGRIGTYVTLSYRWGQGKTLRADHKNVPQLTKGIPLDELPKTILDAVKVTKWLGVQYLWVDALCILMDEQDWLEQSALMHQIYGNALLNISADASEDSDSGFLRSRNSQQNHTCLHPSLIRTFSGTVISAGICPSFPDPENIPHDSSLAKRGWIFQERILSQRRIHFGEFETLWECHSFQASERFPTPRWDVNGGPTDWQLPQKMRIGGDYRNREDPWDEWERLLLLYTPMHLTRPTDKLAAIAGLVHEFISRVEGELTYIAGLWKEDILGGLLWYPTDFDRERRARNRTRTATENGAYCAPSFSWASMASPVEFRPGTISDDEDRVKIEDWRVFPANPNNPYGPLTGGWLKLNGLVANYTKLRKMDSATSTPEAPLNLDVPAEWPSIKEEELVCLIVVPSLEYLVLASTGQGLAEYRRIGLFRCYNLSLEATRKLWTRETITLI